MSTRRTRMAALILAVGVSLSLAWVGCSQDGQTKSSESALERIRSKRKLIVGYIVFPPTVIKEVATGRLGGHHVLTIQEIARQANWKVDFIETDWATFPAGLSTGRFDVCIAPTFVTVPRALAVSFTRPLFFAGNSAIARKGESNRFSSIDSIDRADVTVAVTQGEAGHEYARANFRKAHIVVYPGSDQSLTFQNVLTGRVDVALGDAYVTDRFAALHPDKVVDLFAGNPYNLTPVAWAVRQSDADLLTFLNNSLEALEYQGKLLEFEKAAGAEWLHPKKLWELTPK